MNKPTKPPKRWKKVPVADTPAQTKAFSKLFSAALGAMREPGKAKKKW